MPHLIRELEAAARTSLTHRNWYAALALALSLPDQCSFLETGERKSEVRYAKWFDTWVGSRYIHQTGPDFAPIKTIFLCGQDLYALRCAFLHQGSGDLDRQRARRFLSQIQFVYPDKGSDATLHQFRIDNMLYIQVDRLVQDVCDGVHDWLEHHRAALEGSEHVLGLAVFRPVSSFPIRGENNLASKHFSNRAEAEEGGVFFPPNWPYFSDNGEA